MYVDFFFFPFFDDVSVSVSVRLLRDPRFDFFFPFDDRRFFVFVLGCGDDDALDDDALDELEDAELVFAFL